MEPRTLFLLPRLYLGVIFSVAAYAKVTGTAGFATTLTGFLNGFAMQNGFGWYREFVAAVVLPNVHLFAGLVLAGELFVAVGMLFGFATRAAAVVAILLLANYLCAKGLPIWSPASNDVPDMILAFLVLAGAAGREFGVDRILHERFPAIPAW